MILVTSPYDWYDAVTLTLFKVKFVAGQGTTILGICLLSPGNSFRGDIVTWPFMDGWVRVCVCRALPCGHDSNYSFWRMEFVYSDQS